MHIWFIECFGRETLGALKTELSGSDGPGAPWQPEYLDWTQRQGPGA